MRTPGNRTTLPGMKAETTAEGAETLTGRLERVVFHNPESGWGVLTLSAEDGEAVTAAGVVAGPSAGEHLRLTGHWETHPRFGRQFRFDSYELLRPTTPEAIVRYLGGGLFKGIGPGLAARIVARFGERTLEVLDEQPERLREVSGLGRKRAEALAEAWREQEAQRNVLLFLYRHGMGAALSQRILQRYGDRAVEVVETQPYRLAMDITGIGFRLADRLAASLGLPPDDPQRRRAALIHCLREATSDGHFYLPQALLIEKSAALTDLSVEAMEEALRQLQADQQVYLEPLEDGSVAVYAAGMHHLERQVAQGLQELMATPATPLADGALLEQYLREQEGLGGLELTEEQRRAVELALRRSLAVITGGPGTGKTTVVRLLAWVAQRQGRRLSLAAPTGRAAQRLEQLSGYPAQTLHRLLSWDPFRGGFRHGRGNPLEAEWLIVDEASMLEVPLAASVLEALAPGARLLLVGDADQLPSVGPGQLLGDLVSSGQVPVFRLEQIHRQAQGSLIVRNAHRINRGESPLLPTPRTWQGEDCVFLEREEPLEAADKVVELVSLRLPRQGLERQQIQVITSLHRGPLGVQELNRRLQEALNPTGGRPELSRGETRFRVGDRVLQTVNNYDKLVYNGDIGQISALEADPAALRVRFEQGELTYTRGELDQLELAYALTVHKSQGSEYPAVVLVVHSSHYIMLHRNLLYTGATRAQRMLCLVGDRQGLYKALGTQRQAERYTRLAQRLGAPE